MCLDAPIECDKVNPDKGRAVSEPDSETTEECLEKLELFDVDRLDVLDEVSSPTATASLWRSSSSRGSGQGSFMVPVPSDRFSDEVKHKMKDAVVSMLECMGEDVTREGLLDTPKRVMKSLFFLTKGYYETVEELIGEAIFTSSAKGMVMVRNLDFCSMCEHHMLPFYGKAHIALIPDGKVVGLSKYARIVEMYARRLQLQEDLTDSIALALDTYIKPKGVAVIIEASHMCMVMRGVQKSESSTVTSCFRGCLEKDMYARQEIMRSLHR